MVLGVRVYRGLRLMLTALSALYLAHCSSAERDEAELPNDSSDSARAGASGLRGPSGAAGAATPGGPQAEGEGGKSEGGASRRDDAGAEGGVPPRAGGEAGAPSESEDPEPEPVDSEPSKVVKGLPCEVDALLRKHCQSCHSSNPVAGGGVSLVSYADFITGSKLEPSVNVATRTLKRVLDSEYPMPPAPASPLSSEEIAALRAWVEAGAPPTDCEVANEPGELRPSHDVCTSDAYWTAGSSGSPWMLPGRPCIACHKTVPNNRAPRFAVAGTVYATPHEPDKCVGVPASLGAVVIITDANGVELPPIPVNAGGNFSARWTTRDVPYRAKVVVGDQERVMLTPQTNGDCNLCHTQYGEQGAAGRITIPELADVTLP